MSKLDEHFDDGGSAFPTAQSPENPNLPGHRDVYAQSGMTLRQYYAAHAPDPPDWFEPFEIDIEKLGKPPEIDPANDTEKFIVHRWFQDRSIAVPASLKPKLEEIAAWQKAKREAATAAIAESFFAWRWYYADMMLSGRLEKSRGPHTPDQPVRTDD